MYATKSFIQNIAEYAENEILALVILAINIQSTIKERLVKLHKENINDKPFEYRIRVKYLVFGFLLGLTTLSGLFFLSGITGYVLRTFGLGIPIEPTVEKFILNQISIFGLMLIFSPLVYWMWYTKSRPKKHPQNEPIGLKWDWDNIKDV